MRSFSDSLLVGFTDAPSNPYSFPVIHQCGVNEIRMGFPPLGKFNAGAGCALIETGVEVAVGFGLGGIAHGLAP